MDTIELIKEFENTGFTIVQAEVQVKTMADIKKGLMTESAGEALSKRMDFLNDKIDFVDRKLTDRIDRLERSLNDKMDAKFHGIDLAFKAINDRFSALETKISLSPLINTIYMFGLLMMYLGFTKFKPLIDTWLLR